MMPCLEPGCPVLVERGRCKAHRIRYPDRRPTAARRGYDATWRRVRAAYLRAQPFCEACEREGRTTAAQLVDHIVPLRSGGARLDPSNLQSLCRAHHAAKTARE